MGLGLLAMTSGREYFSMITLSLLSTPVGFEVAEPAAPDGTNPQRGCARAVDAYEGVVPHARTNGAADLVDADAFHANLGAPYGPLSSHAQSDADVSLNEDRAAAAAIFVDGFVAGAAGAVAVAVAYAAAGLVVSGIVHVVVERHAAAK